MLDVYKRQEEQPSTAVPPESPHTYNRCSTTRSSPSLLSHAWQATGTDVYKRQEYHILSRFQLLLHLRFQRAVIAVFIYFFIFEKLIILYAASKLFRREEEIFDPMLFCAPWRATGGRNRKCKIQILRQQIIDDSRLARP